MLAILFEMKCPRERSNVVQNKDLTVLDKKLWPDIKVLIVEVYVNQISKFDM